MLQTLKDLHHWQPSTAANFNNKYMGLCVDPRYHRIIAVATSLSHLNPLMHTSMVLIDSVAQSQGSGAWHTKYYSKDAFLTNEGENFPDSIKKITVKGIRKYFKEFQKLYNYTEIQLGAECLHHLPNRRTDFISQVNIDNNLEKYGPYLYTLVMNRALCVLWL